MISSSIFAIGVLKKPCAMLSFFLMMLKWPRMSWFRSPSPSLSLEKWAEPFLTIQLTFKMMLSSRYLYLSLASENLVGTILIYTRLYLNLVLSKAAWYTRPITMGTADSYSSILKRAHRLPSKVWMERQLETRQKTIRQLSFEFSNTTHPRRGWGAMRWIQT